MSLAQFGACCVRADITGVDILHPWVFTGLLFGAMMPYAFTAYAEGFKDQALDDGHQQETLDASFASANAAIVNFTAKAESAASKKGEDFGKSEAEPFDVVNALQRATSIFRNEMAKNSAFCRRKQHAT